MISVMELAEAVERQFRRFDENLNRAFQERDKHILELMRIIEKQHADIQDLQETVSELVLLTGETDTKDN